MNEILRRLFSPDGSMPQRKDVEKTETLRRQSVRTLARQLDGSVQVERVGRTEFKIAFPETRN